MPQTYMNLSGEAVGEAARFYKIPADHVIVISDDIALPLGKIRVRGSGSAGGHNGLKNIIAHLGTDKFPRVKVGVGAPEHDIVDWVIGSFSAQRAQGHRRFARPRDRRGGVHHHRRRDEPRRTATTAERFLPPKFKKST